MEQAILTFFKRHASRFTDPQVWWSDILNLSRGNFGQVLDVLNSYGIPTDDITKVFAALKS